MIDETTFRRFKNLMLELLRGYPAYVYYGKFESVFAENGVKIVDILDKQRIIEILTEKEIDESKLVQKLPSSDIEEIKKSGIKLRWYRLTSKGVDLAISLVNQDYSEKVLKYSREMSYFTKILIVATIGMLIFAFAQLIISLWF